MTSNLGPILRSNYVNTSYSTTLKSSQYVKHFTLVCNELKVEENDDDFVAKILYPTKALRLSTFGWAICSHVWNNLEGSVQLSSRISF